MCREPDWAMQKKNGCVTLRYFTLLKFDAGVDINEFPNLKKWFDKIYARPAVKKGLEVPKKGALVDKMTNEDDYKKAYSDAQEIISKAKSAAGR